MMESIRAGYEELGVEDYYKKHSEDYNNPHYLVIKDLVNECVKTVDIGHNILDLCCGSGEITQILSEIKADTEYNITGLDPFTGPAYKKNTNKTCSTYDFKDIVNGALENMSFDTIICSFAMHLCEESMLNSLLYQLSRVSKQLIIITPHKRPEVKSWWTKVYGYKEQKVTLRDYKSYTTY